jgi:hypothetical protein
MTNLNPLFTVKADPGLQISGQNFTDLSNRTWTPLGQTTEETVGFTNS